MSIYVSTRTWTHSKAAGSSLLMLLALADRSDEDGISWPGIAYLAEKARVTPRRVKQMLVEAEAAGELYIERNAGRKSTNRYFVVIGLDPKTISRTLIKRFGMVPMEAHSATEKLLEAQNKGEAGYTINSKNGEISDPKGETSDIKGEIQGKEKVKPVSPDSSVNPSINPSEDSLARVLTPKTAGEIPEIQIYQEITGRFPAESQWSLIVELICQVKSEQKLTHDQAVEYLRPFWRGWLVAGSQNPRSLVWLSEWALSGKIPRHAGGNSSSGNGRPKSNQPESPVKRRLRELQEKEQIHGK
jgi:hypothetical protein